MYTHIALCDFTEKVLLKMGYSPAQAASGADVLISADLRGIDSHGVIRLKDYYQLWKAGRVNASPDIKTVHETPSTAVVDADRALGVVAGPVAMQIAIEKAKIAGTGWVAVRNSNHYGIAGYYSLMAVQNDMIGWAMTNANPLVAPTFSIDRFLGTNPIAVAIPAGTNPPFVADFATTPIARGKIDIWDRKGLKAPTGFLQDSKGLPTDDPSILKKGGAMIPLGSDREHGSHKGYCLAAIVDIFSSVLGGANFGPFVPPSVAYLPVLDKKVGEGTGHFFGAMRIDAFRPAQEFKDKMDEWIETFRSARPAEGHDRVLIPGDPEREMETIRKKEGINLHESVVTDLKAIADELGLQF
ncbi:MAG: Ldh family oxidoreductase [Bacteroidota bacterium]